MQAAKGTWRSARQACPLVLNPKGTKDRRRQEPKLQKTHKNSDEVSPVLMLGQFPFAVPGLLTQVLVFLSGQSELVPVAHSP
jgi:hypothetical protein